MQNLKTLSNHELLNQTKILSSEERRLTTQVLWHLKEIESRRLHAELGYSSLFEYAVKELGYSEGAAGRRISAMRLLAVVPEVASSLEKGETNLSTLSTLQNFFQRQEKPLDLLDQKKLVLSLQGQSRRECEKKLAAIDPKPFQTQDRERVLTENLTEIRFVADDLLLEKLKQIQALDAHFQDHPSYLQLFHRMADLCLRKLDVTQKPARRKKPEVRKAKKEIVLEKMSQEEKGLKKRAHEEKIREEKIQDKEAINGKAHKEKAQVEGAKNFHSADFQRAPQGQGQVQITQGQVPQSSSAKSYAITPPAEFSKPPHVSPHKRRAHSLDPDKINHRNVPAKARAISAEVKRQVWQRDQGRCQFKGLSGKICGSKFALEIDHINPVAWGGHARLTNLQLLCRTHNRLKAIRQLGSKTMTKYLTK